MRARFYSPSEPLSSENSEHWPINLKSKQIAHRDQNQRTFLVEIDLHGLTTESNRLSLHSYDQPKNTHFKPIEGDKALFDQITTRKRYQTPETPSLNEHISANARILGLALRVCGFFPYRTFEHKWKSDLSILYHNENEVSAAKTWLQPRASRVLGV
jgi:hypothetical protein